MDHKRIEDKWQRLSSLSDICYLSSFKDRDQRSRYCSLGGARAGTQGIPDQSFPEGTQHTSVLRKHVCGGRKAGTLDGTEAAGKAQARKKACL